MIQGRRSGGFTLIEVLISIAIFALVSTMAYASLVQVMNTRDKLDAERDFWRTMALTFRKLDEDLSQARLRPVRDAYGSELPSFAGQQVDTRALAPPVIELTRGGAPVLGDGVRSDLQRVGYRLTDGMLKRLVWPSLDRAPMAKPVETDMIGDIDELRLRFLSDQNQWVGLWPFRDQQGAYSDKLPRAVEITVHFKTRGEYVRTFLVGPP